MEQRQHAFDVSRTVAQRNREQTDVIAPNSLCLGPEPGAAIAIVALDIDEDGSHFLHLARTKRLL